MPCGHTRTNSNVPKVADRRSRTLFKRALDHNNKKFSPKEFEAPGLVFRNSEQRWIIRTLFALELDAYWKLAPFLPPLQGADQKNHVGSGSRCVPSVSDTTTNSDLVLLGEGMSEISVSEKATSTSLSIENTSVQKDDSDNDHECADCSTTCVSCTSYSDNMVESDQVASLSQECAGEESSCNSTTSTNNALSTTQTPEIILSTFNDNNKNGNPKQNSNFSDNSPSISLDPYNTSVQDSYQNDWNSDTHESCIDDVETLLSIKDESGFNSSGGGMVSDYRNSDTSCQITTVNLCDINTEILNDGCIGNSCWSMDVVNTCNSIERAPCSSQPYNSNDFHPAISGKRGRRARKMTGGANQNLPNRFHGITGKENNHSVWQKVQKIDMDACICETETVNAVSPQDKTSSKHSNRRSTSVGLKQNWSGKTCRNACSDEVGATDLCKVTSNIVRRNEGASEFIDGNSMNNIQKKASSAFKQANKYSRKVSYAAKVNKDRVSENHVQQNGMPILPQVIHDKPISSRLRSPCSIEFQRFLVAPADKIDHCHQESQQKTENYIEEITPSGNSCSTVCGMSLPAAYNDVGVSPSDSPDQVYIEGTSDIRSAKYSKEEFFHTDSENCCLKLEAESLQKECSKLDSSTGSVLRKWVPVGRKESTMSNMTHLDNMKVSIVEDLVPDKFQSRHVKAEVSTSNTQYFTSLTRGQRPCSSPRTEDKDFSSVEADQVNRRLRNHPYEAEESVCVLPVSSCQTHEVPNEGFSRFETDLDKILLAVQYAYKLHAAAGAHQASGSPLADIERFLYSASPVIGQTHSTGSCRACSKEQLIGDSMCLCHIPNISLKRLLQWYEEPGCFGLEVKAQEYHNSKRFGNGYSEFSAYFVPYLSAVQLFGRSRNTRNGSANEVVAISCEAEKRLQTPLSKLCSLPILSMLVPQPFNETDTCSSDSSSSAKYEHSNQFYGRTCVGDEELIFEYFESDQPPRRRPLFEKIKELICGDTSSNCQAFGDPLMLENINLRDLHPASWYSVAWYPIYRIPDGNFRAAFLTYHSLGHFVHRSFSFNASDSLCCIASPVVGLLSYNDKGECWFKLKNSYSKVIRNEEARFFNPSEILKERLMSLKKTATVMARASVSKGNQRSVNRHPDYEFFISRSRWGGIHFL